tara:strand:- start:4 stop:483 length:480 start_codon:yes stop_codon:yes gene_type:complete
LINSYLFSQESSTDCIFDIKTQDDSFLKEIDELKNYKWDQKNKTATIKISEKETIKIFRGGCNDFLLKGEFIVSNNITFENNKGYILNKISWISKLIFEKSDYIKIENCLKKNNISINKSNPDKIHINLLNHEIYNSYTIFYNSENEKFNTFSIEYFLN